MQFIKTDGGRAAAGFVNKHVAGDCVARAICIVTQLPYTIVYDRLCIGNATQRSSKHCVTKGMYTASHGIYTKRKWFQDYMTELGFVWTPTMLVGSGCKIHLRSEELPKGRLVVSCSKHLTAVIDGVLYDMYDCSREGTRCVYGYWLLK